MNKNDFDIFSPTSKQKEEMKERLIQAAESFSATDDNQKRSVSVNAEKLIEVKPKAEKSGFMLKFTAIAAAFAFVAAATVFVAKNNNGVQVFTSTDNSSVSHSILESTNEETVLSEEKQSVADKVSSLNLTGDSYDVKIDKENKDNKKYVDYSEGKIKIDLTVNTKFNADELPPTFSHGWYVTLNGVLQNISVNGEEESEIYIHRLVKDTDYSGETHSYNIEIEFEPVVAEEDKDKTQLGLSIVQISNPDFRVDPVYPICANLHSNIVISTRILNVSSELKIKETKKSDFTFTEEFVSEEIKGKYPSLDESFYDKETPSVRIIGKYTNTSIEADENGKIEFGAIVSGNGRLRLLFLVNGIPSKLSDGSDYIEIDAKKGYLYTIKTDKLLNVDLYDTVNILIMNSPDDGENSYFTRACFADVVFPYNYTVHNK